MKTNFINLFNEKILIEFFFQFKNKLKLGELFSGEIKTTNIDLSMGVDKIESFFMTYANSYGLTNNDFNEFIKFISRYELKFELSKCPLTITFNKDRLFLDNDNITIFSALIINLRKLIIERIEDLLENENLINEYNIDDFFNRNNIIIIDLSNSEEILDNSLEILTKNDNVMNTLIESLIENGHKRLIFRNIETELGIITYKSKDYYLLLKISTDNELMEMIINSIFELQNLTLSQSFCKIESINISNIWYIYFMMNVGKFPLGTIKMSFKDKINELLSSAYKCSADIFFHEGKIFYESIIGIGE